MAEPVCEMPCNLSPALSVSTFHLLATLQSHWPTFPSSTLLTQSIAGCLLRANSLKEALSLIPGKLTHAWLTWQTLSHPSDLAFRVPSYDTFLILALDLVSPWKALTSEEQYSPY